MAAGLPTVGVPSALPLASGAATVQWDTLAGRTLADLAAAGVETSTVLSRIAHSLGLGGRDEPVRAEQLANRFDPAALPTEPWILTADEWA